jgi:hypothetical protein
VAPAPGSTPNPLTPVPPPFAVLSPEVRAVLAEQLKQPGDLSPVIEDVDTFAVFRLRERTAEQIALDVLAVPKLTLEEWLAEIREPGAGSRQPGNT